MTTFERVAEFRRKMKLPISTNPHMLPADETSYFARFILEELSEYLRANEEDNLVDAADALIDLVYVTMGCAHAMGLPFDELFDEVHKSNMLKVPANDFMRSLRGSQYDVVKPVGWAPPEPMMAAIIQSKQKGLTE